MSFAYGFGLPHWHPLSGAFSPLSLFSGGVQGAFYDPSDPTVLFSDRAGTTPCGTPGGGSVVPVGLMLDKSQGLVLGSELVTTANTAAAWTPYGSNTVTNDDGGIKITFVGGTDSAFGAFSNLNAAGCLSQNLTANKYYEISFSARVLAGNNVEFGIRNGSTTPFVAVATVTATAYTAYKIRFATNASYTSVPNFTLNGSFGAGEAIWVRDISVKELAGNHAIAANDTTARPELSARVNLITNSENFAGTGWSGTATVATDVTTAPNGTTTADSITAAATSANQYIRRSPAGLLVNVQFTWSVAAKKNTSDWVYLRFWDTSNAGIGNTVWFNVANGTVGSNTAGTVGSITNLGDGWYRCTVTRTIGGSIAFNEIDIAVSNADNTINATAGNSVFVWGADLRPANIGIAMPAYQRISDANTYDAVGFPRYLACNGTSSAMSTPGNVNLSGTDKATVFAGVRKNADVSIIAEFSVNAGANSAFLLATGGWGAENGTYVRQSRGTATAFAQPAANSYPSPRTDVLTGTSDIAGDSVVLRINGTQVATSATDQGTGNYGSYPLFIGSRNNASTFLNGNIYSLIVVGSAVSAGQISATEQWVAQRTGITI